MSNQNRVNAGVPTGGQFAAQDRAEAIVTLQGELASAGEEATKIAHRRSRLSAALIAEAILGEYPTATHLRLEPYDDAVIWWPGEIIDADGNVLSEDDELGLSGWTANIIADRDLMKPREEFPYIDSDLGNYPHIDLAAARTAAAGA